MAGYRAFAKALRRLWNIATCTHRNAMKWAVLVPDVEVEGEYVEMHFCRACGRLLVGVRHSDQPQHNHHWLKADQMDDKADRLPYEPHTPALRELARRP